MRYGRRFPSFGSLLILIIGVAVLLSGTDGDEGRKDLKRDRPGHGPAEERGRPGRERAGGGERPATAGVRDRPPPGVRAVVVSVTDGDTARMLVAGHEVSVRYIGIDTPESAIPGVPPECFGKRAAKLNERLVEGRRVRLAFGRERRDVYDRLLAYVYRGGRLVNARIIRRGYARTLAIAPNTDLADRFARLQQAAANAGRGLWGKC